MARKAPRGKYAQLHDSEWQRTLSPLAKRYGCETLAVYLYLLSNPARNLIGIYSINYDYACIDLDLDMDTWKHHLRCLVECDLISVDDETSEIFVKDTLRTQCGGVRPDGSDNRSIAVDNWILGVESEQLLSEFNERYEWW